LKNEDLKPNQKHVGRELDLLLQQPK